MFRKAAAIAAALIMLAGCSSSGSSNSSSAAESAAVSSEEAPVTTAAPAETEPEEEKLTEEEYMEKCKNTVVELMPDAFDGKHQDYTYPEFQKLSYYSKTAERDTPVNVLLPADYSEDKQYPVLYILHGYWDSEDWMARPVVNLNKILKNLQENGEAEDMIIVCPYIFCSKELPRCTGMNDENSLAYDNFINDLLTDLMPFIESKFSIAKGPDNTAITGFSMGGRESLFIGIKHPELFGYIGACCPAPGLIGQIKESDMVFPEDQKPRLLFISSSQADGVVSTFPDSYRKAFEKNGVDFVSHVLKRTGHDHTSVRPHLYNFLRMIFK